LGETDIASVAIGRALMFVAGDGERSDNTRAWAIRLAHSKGASDADLIGLLAEIDAARKDEVELFLIERNHRPTIERRIAAILDNDAAMRAAEVPIPQTSPLSWIGHIRSDVYWDRLIALRAQSLRLELPNVAGAITGTMNNIDGVRLAAVILEQLPITPASWREVQRMSAGDYEREARLRQAQAIPFERVIQKLRMATSLAMFKIWCEGLTDGPTIDEFVRKLPAAAGLGIVTQSLGGWFNILSPNWRPDRLYDGCHGVIVLVDGDKGRDLNLADRPLKADAERVRRILAGVGVELFVLDRYGMENYFSQAACEAVFGRPAAAAFPLPLYLRAQIPGHSRNDNPAIARSMTVADLAGTDLLRILEEVVRRSRV